ncbi:MAG: mechanosensitive ion channel, partial [Planctomycetes bacterium]|nr:mechanosensitive ion channel [Planctomycetota bacterium]
MKIFQNAGAEPAAVPTTEPITTPWWEQIGDWLLTISSRNQWVLVAIVLLTAWAANWIAKRLIVRGMASLASRTNTKWDDHLVKNRVFEKLSHIAPTLVIYAWASLLFPDNGDWEATTQRLMLAFIIVIGGRVVSSLMDSALSIFRSTETTDSTALRSYIQVGKILLWIVVVILAVAVLMQRSPTGLLTGLGAMMTIVLLVFKDSILGFVASIQLTRDDLIRCGDWIEVPNYGADGDVMEVTLHAVKVQNWDKTISTVPTPALVTGGFKNWRGMSESGGRRIKRSLNVDMNSVRFVDDDLLQRLKKVQYIQQYLDSKIAEITSWNLQKKVDESSLVNGRRLTNLGTFRAYVEAYLQNHSQISKNLTFLVRQLEPSPTGVPIQIYVFSEEQRWVHYEAIAGDIF